jgi:hypothetical protein
MTVNGVPKSKQEEKQAPEDKLAIPVPNKEMNPTPKVEPPPEPTLAGESPGIKRRQSRVEPSSVASTQLLPTKKLNRMSRM